MEKKKKLLKSTSTNFKPKPNQTLFLWLFNFTSYESKTPRRWNQKPLLLQKINTIHNNIQSWINYVTLSKATVSLMFAGCTVKIKDYSSWCVCVYAHVCVHVRQTVRDSVYSKSRASFPIGRNTKRNTPGGLLGSPSSHRGRAEERPTYRK